MHYPQWGGEDPLRFPPEVPLFRAKCRSISVGLAHLPPPPPVSGTGTEALVGSSLRLAPLSLSPLHGNKGLADKCCPRAKTIA
jgi:hypothetical protein